MKRSPDTAGDDTAEKAAGCLGKRRFECFADAQKSLSQIRHKQGSHPYRCHYCQAYHIGGQVLNSRRRPKRR